MLAPMGGCSTGTAGSCFALLQAHARPLPDVSTRRLVRRNWLDESGTGVVEGTTVGGRGDRWWPTWPGPNRPSPSAIVRSPWPPTRASTSIAAGCCYPFDTVAIFIDQPLGAPAAHGSAPTLATAVLTPRPTYYFVSTSPLPSRPMRVTNFSVFRRAGRGGDGRTEERIDLPETTAFCWHAYLPDHRARARANGYRVARPMGSGQGALAPTRPSWLLDPYAKGGSKA